MFNFKPIMKAGTVMDLDKTRNNLRFTRARIGMSMNRLSELSGVSKTHISNIELGHRNFTIATARKLYAALKQYKSDKDAGIIEPEKPDTVYPQFLE